MHKKKRFIAVSAVLALSTSTAWADRGYFAVASVGDSSVDLGTSFPSLLSDDDRSFEIGVGYAFNPHLSVQAGYHDFGKFDGELDLPCTPDTLCLPPDECPPDTICFSPPIQLPFRVDVTGWSLRVTGTYPLGERFAAFASAGVLVWDADLRFAPMEGTAIFASGFGNEGDDLMYDAGLRWRLSDRWNIQASYEKVDLDVESAKLGVLFRF